MVTIGAIGGAKLQSNRHHHKTKTQLFTGRMPFRRCQILRRKKISPNNSVEEPKEKSQPYDIHEQKTNEQLIVKRCVHAYFSVLISNVHGSSSCHFLIS